MKRVFIAVLLIMAAVNTNAQFLFRISGNGLEQPSYMLGTIHTLHGSVLDHTPVYVETESLCKQFYTEFDITDQQLMNELNSDIEKTKSNLRLPEGKTILDILSNEQIETVDVRVKEIFGLNLSDPKMKSFWNFQPRVFTYFINRKIQGETIKKYVPQSSSRSALIDETCILRAKLLGMEYIAYIASFNPQEGKERMEFLEEHLGYWAPAVYAAAHVARRLHQGQKDKGGNDYFSSHLLKVGQCGCTWKRQIVGFLHDAEEDTGHDVETVLRMVEEQLHEWGEHPDDKSWIDELDKYDISPYPSNSIFYPSDDDWKEMADALRVLNHHTVSNREDYINRFRTNILALHVKLEDMKNNMDISRITNPTADDYARLERYKKEYEILLLMLRDYYEPN